MVYKKKGPHASSENFFNEISQELKILTPLTEHKRTTRNGDINNHIAEHYLQTKHQIDWDSATFIKYSTDYCQRLS